MESISEQKFPKMCVCGSFGKELVMPSKEQIEEILRGV